MTGPLTLYFLCEGPSDEALVAHLVTLVSRRTNAEVLGLPRAGGGPVRDKLLSLREEGVPFDIVAVHRDADARDPRPRIAEVQTALGELGMSGYPVVPVQATEAWLLVDEAAIRAAVGRPSGREPLGIPRLGEVERTHDPKAVLRAALLAASGATGRRHDEASRAWSAYRRILLERLDVDGPVTRLTSWQRLVHDVDKATTLL